MKNKEVLKIYKVVNVDEVIEFNELIKIYEVIKFNDQEIISNRLNMIKIIIEVQIYKFIFIRRLLQRK